MEKSILYFDNVGESNTDAVITAAAKRAAELQISHIVVASTSGKNRAKNGRGCERHQYKGYRNKPPVRAE